MKKKLVWILIAVLCISTFAAGCGSEETSDKPYNYDLEKYVKLGEYKGMEMPKIDIEVTDIEFEYQLASRLLAAGIEEETISSGAIKAGDTANIDYEGKVDGVAFDGGTAQNQTLSIGSGQFIPGFEESLIGKPIGETAVIDVTFPASYGNAELAGKDAQFTVTVHSVSRVKWDQYTPDFVKANGDFESTEAYEKSIRDSLYAQKLASGQENQKQAVVQEVVAGSEILEYPDKEMKVAEERVAQVIQYNAEAYQMQAEEFYAAAKVSTLPFAEYLSERAKEIVTQELVLNAIAQKEDITITDEEYKTGYESILSSQGFTDEEYKAQTGKTFEETVGKSEIETSLLTEKVADFLVENAKEV